MTFSVWTVLLFFMWSMMRFSLMSMILVSMLNMMSVFLMERNVVWCNAPWKNVLVFCSALGVPYGAWRVPSHAEYFLPADHKDESYCCKQCCGSVHIESDPSPTSQGKTDPDPIKHWDTVLYLLLKLITGSDTREINISLYLMSNRIRVRHHRERRIRIQLNIEIPYCTYCWNLLPDPIQGKSI